MGKEIEVETETDKEFDSWIVGDTYKTEVWTDKDKWMQWLFRGQKGRVEGRKSGMR